MSLLQRHPEFGKIPYTCVYCGYIVYEHMRVDSVFCPNCQKEYCV